MFKKKLKDAMIEADMNQIQLSKATGISPSLISYYCSGAYIPNNGYIKRIANALKCKPGYFTEIIPVKKVVTVSKAEIKNISITEAAERTGKSKEFISASLQSGIAPFGFAVKISGDKWSYHISPKKFNEYMGVIR